MIQFVKIATIYATLTFFCAGCFGPVLTCPDSLAVGEEALLVVSTVYDAIDWEIDPPLDAAAFLLADGREVPRATTSVMGDPAYGERGEAEIRLRATAAGMVTIRIQETSIGPPILPPPRPAGGAACTIEIAEEVPPCLLFGKAGRNASTVRCCDTVEDCTQAPCYRMECLFSTCNAVEFVDGEPCDDGDACTTDDHCEAEAIKCVGVPVVCDPGESCIDGVCTKADTP